MQNLDGQTQEYSRMNLRKKWDSLLKDITALVRYPFYYKPLLSKPESCMITLKLNKRKDISLKQNQVLN